MAAHITGRQRPTKPKKQARIQKRKRDDVDVEQLVRAIQELEVKADFQKFNDFPLSEPTKAGLKASHFTTLTTIQKQAIAPGLKGRDILGAAKTGSGKTLAFVIPVLENLYRAQCVGGDAGLGAMIISPTRELAIQIFDVLFSIGKYGHLFAAGLVIGGKSLQEEQHALARMNIVVCTPGRILQHLSQTAAFHLDNLSMLVLDEADRIMDMGFQKDVDAIIEYLPPQRQTLLFSATQTKRVSDLARLSLKDPDYISVHETADTSTPKNLQQNYIVTPLPQKLDTLWSFIQSSKKSKMLVFLSSGKQVKFVHESFRRLQPGIPLLHLHGRQKQATRLDVMTKFTRAQYSCLFATDVAARGLDFPAVDWVVQLDCPEDADTYIHRAGRTARYERDGRAVLFLDPSEEEGMLTALAARKVPIERINVRQKKQQSIQNKLQAMCFKDPELKYLGQKAFVSYVRSIHVQKNKEIFDVRKYDLEDMAASMGLPGAPRIKYTHGDAEANKRRKNAPKTNLDDSDEDVQDEGHGGKKQKNEKAVRTKYDRMFERTNQDILSGHYQKMLEQEKDDDGNEHGKKKQQNERNGLSVKDPSRIAANGEEEDDLFTVKKHIPAMQPSDSNNNNHMEPSTSTPTNSINDQVDSNRRARALKSRAKSLKLLSNLDPSSYKSTHLHFDESGNPHNAEPSFEDETAVGKDAKERERKRMDFVEGTRKAFDEIDKGDREIERERLREKKRKRKEIEKRVREEDMGDDKNLNDEGYEGSRLEVNTRPFEELADLYPDESNQNNKDQKTPGLSDSSEDSSSSSPRQRDNPKRKKQKLEKQKKWFEKSPPASASLSKYTQPETLEDLETLASGLLG